MCVGGGGDPVLNFRRPRGRGAHEATTATLVILTGPPSKAAHVSFGKMLHATRLSGVILLPRHEGPFSPGLGIPQAGPQVPSALSAGGKPPGVQRLSAAVSSRHSGSQENRRELQEVPGCPPPPGFPRRGSSPAGRDAPRTAPARRPGAGAPEGAAPPCRARVSLHGAWEPGRVRHGRILPSTHNPRRKGPRRGTDARGASGSKRGAGRPRPAAWAAGGTGAMGGPTRGGSSRRPWLHFPGAAALVSLRPPFGTAQLCGGERSPTWRWPPVFCLCPCFLGRCPAGPPDSGLWVPPR